MGFNLQSFIGANVGQFVKDVVGTFHADPTIVAQNKERINELTLDLQGKLQDALSNEVTQSAEVIKAEAQSQSWLPRNVRPLLLLMWGTLITFNYFLPLLAHFSLHFQTMQPLQLPDWCYKLTAIGFTGYVTARTFEKWTDTDH